MTIKDKRDAVVEAARRHASKPKGSHPVGTGFALWDAVRELEAAETPLKLEGVVSASHSGDRVGGVVNIELRGHLNASPALVTVSIHENDAAVGAFREKLASRFCFVLTEIMDGES